MQDSHLKIIKTNKSILTQPKRRAASIIRGKETLLITIKQEKEHHQHQNGFQVTCAKN